MDNMELKKVIAKLLSEQSTLPEIQNILKTEYQHRMTFLDLRLLASELENVDWKQFDPEKKEKKEEEKNESSKEGDGTTRIEMNKVQRLGAIASGSVTFISGASADWIIDQSGHLGFDKANGEPTQEDLQDFQTKLQSAISGGGGY